MTKYLSTIINSASAIFLLHSFCVFIYKQFNPGEEDDKYKLLNSRIKHLQDEIKEFTLIIDNLEEKVDNLEEKVDYLQEHITIKEKDLLESTLHFNNKLEFLVNNNYDVIQKENE